jgi:serine/threonine-protein kinase
MNTSSLDKAAATPTPSLSGASLSCLPPDLLQEASQRLGWAGLIYAGTFFFASFGTHFVGTVTGVLPEHSLADNALQNSVSVVAILLGFVVFLFSRYSNLRPELLLDIGLIFEVVGAFGISMTQFWGIFPEWDPALLDRYMGIPWECVWIIFFPMLAPNTPGKTLLASIAAASTGLLVVLLSKAGGATSPEVPMSIFAVYFLFTTYLCVGIAYLIASIVYRFGCRLQRAREVGSYHLTRLLGEGGMGEVWLAKHRMLARPAAVKLIRPEAFGSDEAGARTVMRRFEREAQATAALGSTHTIELYDFGTTEEGAFYYVMELLRGVNLDDLVKKFGPAPAARAVYLLRQVCHSLGDAHDNGMIHRDIKPANILSCHLGPDYDFVKVLDFGLVKAAGTKETGATELTAEGIATGTPAFMAPEMALGKGYIDGRVDIYGLGCVAYWLVTGQHVFKGDTPLATVVAHVQEKPVPPSQRTELEIPEALEQAILKCLEKDPDNRPQTAAELNRMWVESVDGDWSCEIAAEWWGLHLPDSELVGFGDAGEETGSQEILAVKR